MFDLILKGGTVYDGSGADGRITDVGITDGTIAEVGALKPDADTRVIDVAGLIVAPGFVGEDGRFDLATAMLRFTFPYLFFVSLTAFAGGVLNTYGKFGAPAFTPVILNVVLIASALWLAPKMMGL